MPAKSIKLPKQRTMEGPAQIWKRALALMADLLIINLAVIFPFRKIVQGMIPETASFKEAYNFLQTDTELASAVFAVTIWMAVLALLYLTIMEYKLQQTVGKILLNIYVKSETKRLSFWQCLLRNLFIMPFFPFFLLW